MRRKYLSGKRVAALTLATTMSLGTGTQAFAAEVKEEPKKEDFMEVDEEAFEQAKEQYESENPEPAEEDFVGTGVTTEEYKNDVAEWEEKEPDKGLFIGDKEGYDAAVGEWKEQAPTEDSFTKVDEDAYNGALEEHESAKPTEDGFVKTDEYNSAVDDYKAENEEPTEDGFQVDDTDSYNAALQEWQDSEPKKEDYTGEEYKQALEEWNTSKPSEDTFSTVDEDAFNSATTEYEGTRPAEEGFDNVDQDALDAATDAYNTTVFEKQDELKESNTTVNEEAYQQAKDLYDAGAPTLDETYTLNEEMYMYKVEENATEAKPDAIEHTDMNSVVLSENDQWNLKFACEEDTGVVIVNEDQNLIDLQLVEDAYAQTEGAVADPYDSVDSYKNGETTYTQFMGDNKSKASSLAMTITADTELVLGTVTQLIGDAIYSANDSYITEEQRYTEFVTELEEVVAEYVEEGKFNSAEEGQLYLDAILDTCVDASSIAQFPNLTSRDFTNDSASNLFDDFCTYLDAAQTWGWAQENRMDYVSEEDKTALETSKTTLAEYKANLTSEKWSEILTQETVTSIETAALSNEAYKALYDSWVASANVDINEFYENSEGATYADVLAEYNEGAPSIEDYTTFNEEAYNAALQEWLLANPAPSEDDYKVNAEGKTYEQVVAEWAAGAPTADQFMVLDEEAYNSAVTEWKGLEPEDTTDYSDFVADSEAWADSEPVQEDFKKLDAEAFTAAHNAWAEGMPNQSDFIDTESYNAALEEWANAQPTQDDFMIPDEEAYNNAVAEWEATAPDVSEYGFEAEAYKEALDSWNAEAPVVSEYDSIAFGAAQAEWLANYPIVDDYSTLNDEAYQKAVADYKAYLQSLANKNHQSSNSSSSSSSESSSSSSQQEVIPETFSVSYMQAKPRGTEIAPQKVIIAGTQMDISEYKQAMDSAIDEVRVTAPTTPEGTMYAGLCEWVTPEFQTIMNSLSTCNLVQKETRTVEGKAVDALGNTIYRYGNFDGGCKEAVCILMGTTTTGEAVFSYGNWDASQNAYVTIFTEDIVTLTAFAVTQ